MRLGQPTLISKQRTPELPCTAKQGPRIYRTTLRINGLRPLLRVERISISCNVALGEPNELATNSRSFWLAARCPGLAGNGQYCGKTVALWYDNIARRSKRGAPLSHSWRLSRCLRRAVRFWLTAAPARCRLTSVGDFCVELHQSRNVLLTPSRLGRCKKDTY